MKTLYKAQANRRGITGLKRSSEAAKQEYTTKPETANVLLLLVFFYDSNLLFEIPD